MAITNTKTLITLKTDKSLKRDAQRVAEKIGLSLSALINGFLRQFVRTKEVSFSASEKPNAYLRMAIAEAMKEYKEGKLPPPVDSVDELVKELKA